MESRELESSRDLVLLSCLLAIVATAGELQVESQSEVYSSGFWLSLLVFPLSAGVFRAATRSNGLSRLALWCAIVAAIGQPLAAECASRLWQQGGQSPEATLLAGLRNLLWVLFATARTRRDLQLSVFAGGSLLLFTAVASDDASALLMIMFGGLVSLWFVRMHVANVVDGRRAALRVAASAQVGVACSLVCLAIVCACGDSVSTARALAGFLPFSGGTGWYDPWAQDGIGDGEQLVAATDDADSTGPIDSKVMLSSHRPSLYDVFDDMYGEPQKMREKQDRAIALSQRPKSDGEKEAADSEHAGKEFSTRRKPKQKAGRKLADVEAVALVYVDGPAPVHLRLTAYDQFDGANWKEALPAASGNRSLEQQQGSDWFQVACPGPPDGITERHRIKIGKLSTSRIPSPARLTRVRLAEVNRADFFRWEQPDILAVDRASLPAGTLLEVECQAGGVDSETADFAHLLEPQTKQMGADAGSPLSPQVAGLLNKWTAGTSPGWEQVVQFAKQLASHCQVDSAASHSRAERDILELFLIDQRRGPDYLFATAAAVMLRQLGYQTRLVSGFYGSDDNYLSSAGQLLLASRDVHFWLEILDVAGNWIPLEVTPGFRLRVPQIPWTQWLTRRAELFLLWCVTRRQAWLVLLALLLIAWVLRVEILDRLATTIWQVKYRWGGGSCWVPTLWLLEYRAGLAGTPRPLGQTVRSWLSQFAVDVETSAAIAGIVSSAEAELYAQTQSPSARDGTDTVSYRILVKALTRRAIGASFAARRVAPGHISKRQWLASSETQAAAQF